MTELWDLIAFVQPPDVSAGATLMLLAVAFVGAVMMAMTSIGGGFVMVFLAQVLPPFALIPIHGITQLGSNLSRFVLMFRYIRWYTLPSFILGSLIGGVSGALLFVQIPPAVLQLMIGSFILITVFVQLPALNAKHMFATGLISNFLSMFVGATATFVSSVIKGLNLSPPEHVATHAAMISFQHTLKIIAFGFLGFAYGPYVPFVAAMIACSFIGTMVGKKVLLAAGAKYFRPLLNIILIVLSVRLIWVGIEGILADQTP